MVKRYTWVGIRGMNYSDSGNYVSYEDYQKLEAELEQLRQQVKAPADDGWIEWGGGDQPVEDYLLVETKWSDGSLSYGEASRWRWSHKSLLSDNNLIAYRVVKP